MKQTRYDKWFGLGFHAITDISEEMVATQFWHRVGVDLVRANCRAFHRRLVSHGGDVLGAVAPLGGAAGLQVVEGL